MSAADLGKKLLAEVEEVGFDEILNTLRSPDDHEQKPFDIPQLNVFLQCIQESQTATSKVQGSSPIIEITSQRPCSGKTNLLYQMIVTAVLPFHLGGRQAAIIFLDTDNHFSATRLAQQMRKTIVTYTKEDFVDEESLSQVLEDSLKHVHVLRPQSLPALITTINSLPHYLFNPTKHKSFDRAISFIALDSASAFYWQSRADAENAALQASFQTKDPTTKVQQPTGYIQLAASLKNASRILSTLIIYTTRDFNPPQKASGPSSAFFMSESHSIRPSLPPPWPSLPTLRLIVRRAPIRSLPAEVTVEDAVRETEMRQKVVAQGKFECFVNEWGLDERTLQNLREKGNMFDFLITSQGIKIGDGPE
ncbi:DNA repair protein XRCC2 [Pseudocercospora fuligena]|uniref:DNA repair protein XRCC2 n=1 Tax=Pseudocercospora fuligena TaxID=685502 RepID=A0A8H6VBE7_9PEZI|nr:DNA repair protein XRCC2 [Pseudocercospora fuligena]